jgi:hypothetical protein
MAEAALLLARINAHHGNAQVEDLQVQVFHDELRSDMTVSDAVEAIRRFYAANSTGRWMMSGDVNQGVKKIRSERQPSDERVYQLTKGTDLAGDIRYLQALRKNVSAGLSLEQAHEKATATMKQLEASSNARKQPALTSTGNQDDRASKTAKNIDWTHVGRKLK